MRWRRWRCPTSSIHSLACLVFVFLVILPGDLGDRDEDEEVDVMRPPTDGQGALKPTAVNDKDRIWVAGNINQREKDLYPLPQPANWDPDAVPAGAALADWPPQPPRETDGVAAPESVDMIGNIVKPREEEEKSLAAPRTKDLTVRGLLFAFALAAAAPSSPSGP
eukprot:TRINITY_DN7451_c0_g1_i1.p1 TRINITY_DN7451_c0_g1~~TRINITY_DN7451_c0_g1_i1.p1  ORF type:complete len:165 (+),score=40.10 TRINITY_DN7451_c0_g1_i1:61-555(+)